MGGLREELLIPFRGASAAGRELWEGTIVLAGHGRRGLRRLVRVAIGVLDRHGRGTNWLETAGICVLVGIFTVPVVLAAGIAAVRLAAPYAGWIGGAAVTVWVAAAWMAAPPRVEHGTETPSDSLGEAPADPTRAFAQWLLHTIGNQPGIHLRELYPAMRQLPGHDSRDDARCREALRHLGIPVHRSLRIGHIAGRSGVRRADVEAILSPDGESRGDSTGDAGQSVDSPPLSRVGDDVESAVSAPVAAGIHRDDPSPIEVQ
jgi:hypothetical protein